MANIAGPGGGGRRHVSDAAPSIGPLLRGAGPDDLAEVVREFARSAYRAADAELLLADYRVAGLWPVLRRPEDPGDPLGGESTPARCYGSQQPLVQQRGPSQGDLLFVPVTAWGERLGVLVLEFPGATDAAHLDEVRGAADELAVALVAADRSTDRYRLARRRQRMTMAAEMQWDMLPGRSLRRPEFLLAGQLEPAYAVCGDHFDWAVTGDRLTLTVLNGHGQGIDATILTALAVNGMRNARRSGGDLREQAELASDAVFTLHGGERHVATLLLSIQLATGQVTAIDAGSPIATRLRGGDLQPIDLDRQLPLGMFADTRYAPQSFTLEPGDRLFIVSDGIHAAAPGGQLSYGERALAAAVRATRLQPASDAVGSVMRSLHEYHRGEDLVDDAVIVCLDWHGAAR
jgi:serine phosphatase RsbU (regulator of sigma subunit)